MEVVVSCGDIGASKPSFFCFSSPLFFFFFPSLGLGDGGEGVGQRAGGGVVGGREDGFPLFLIFFFIKYNTTVSLFFCTVSLLYLAVSRTRIQIVPCLHRSYG